MPTAWLIRRLLRAALLLFAVSVLSFLMGRFAPGSFFDDLRLNPQISPHVIETLRARYGLDQPAAVQYGRWAASTLRGDFGTSLGWQQPVAPILWPRMQRTLALTVEAAGLAWIFGVPWGMLAAHRRRSVGAALSLAFLAIPEVLLALLLMYAVVRWGSASVLSGFALPLTVVTAGAFPGVFLHTRAATEQILDSWYVRSARAHGITGVRLWLRYILPGAANPLISLLGLSFGGLIGASLIAEAIFSRPGIGPLFLEAISTRDLDMITGIVLLSALFLICGNLIADLLLAWNDPRIGETDV
jgi:peptide/nickel transport system permease protein